MKLQGNKYDKGRGLQLSKRELEVGKLYGTWIILNNAYKIDKWGARLINVRCTCGFETFIAKSTLIRHTSKGCKECRDLKKFKGCGDLSLSYFNQIKDNARKRNLKFEISIEFMWELFKKQNGLCALSGSKMQLSKKNIQRSRKDHTASIDRIDSMKDYTIDNVQWVHKKINQLKMDLPNEEFIQLCNQVTKHTKK